MAMFTKSENSFLTTGHGRGTSMCASAYLSSRENPFQVADSEFRPLDSNCRVFQRSFSELKPRAWAWLGGPHCQPAKWAWLGVVRVTSGCQCNLNGPGFLESHAAASDSQKLEYVFTAFFVVSHCMDHVVQWKEIRFIYVCICIYMYKSNMQEICSKYARDMHKYAGNMQLYAKNMQVYAKNMQEICTTYANI